MVFAADAAAVRAAEKRQDGIRMKTNATNVLIGAAVIAAVVYYLYPTAFGREGFQEEPQSQKIGGYIALAIFLLIAVGGIIAAFNAGGRS